MKRSTLFLFLFVFALSEVFLAAKRVQVRASVGKKNSSGLRFVRSPKCPDDSQCDNTCKSFGLNGGFVDNGYCFCGDQNDAIDWDKEENCVKLCDGLGVGRRKILGDGACVCNDCE
ncbi:hypothetical protein DdX_17525 [Ditylenchus destructor]|uniref:Defensin-like protein n=1 Tax=Ditylenchus destructor TaxID=166010 RepID=A0AAD4MME1_9BILA|nr:hypothetical protein DdX_17525 [Ditylenchus destructor]